MREPMRVFSPVGDPPSGTKEEELEKVSPRQQLEGILATTLSPENVHTYLDDALARIIELVDQTVAQYRSTHRDTTLEGKEIEDAAFIEFGLQAIDEILPIIQKKQNQMAEVAAWIQDHIGRASSVIVPPDESGFKTGSGSRGFEKKGIKNRLQTLLYILKTDGHDLGSVLITEGEKSENAIRQQSYVEVSIPSLKRLVFVCDEEYNASYFFDTEKVDEIEHKGAGTLLLRRMTKDELNALIKEHPGIGRRLIQTPTWAEKVRALLNEPISEQEYVERARSSTETSKERRVSNSELDPWRAFWTDPTTRRHYGTPTYLAKKLSERFGAISRNTVKKLVKRPGLSMIPIVDIGGRDTAGHSYEEIVEKFGPILSLPQIASEENEEAGDWKAFAKDGGIHYGTEYAIAERMKISRTAFKNRVDWSLVRRKDIRGLESRKHKAFAFEDVVKQPKMNRFLSVPPVETVGDWSGFYMDQQTKKHFGAITAIRLKINKDLNVNIKSGNNQLQKAILDPSVSALDLRDGRGIENKGYAYEDVVAVIDTYLKSSRLSNE